MKRMIAAAAAFACVLSAPSVSARSMLHDPIALNIGVNCQWQARCMALQRRAMKRALAYVRHAHPPEWKVQLCNRNAGRGGYRVDWVGFDHCIHNPLLKRSAEPHRRRAAVDMIRRRRRLT